MSVELATPPELPQNPLELVALGPQHVSIFGSQHYLGMEVTSFHRATATVDGAKIYCVPDGDRSLTATSRVLAPHATSRSRTATNSASSSASRAM